MKHRLSTLLLLLLPCAFAQAQHSITFAVGTLYSDSTATTPAPDGTLVQVVVSRSDNTFTAPTAGSFVGNSADDVVVASFAVDHTTTGLMGSVLTYLNNLVTLLDTDTGRPFALRWYPSLTVGASTPGAGTIFGQFHEDSANVGGPGEIGFFIGAPGSSMEYSLVTLSAGGSTYADSVGAATEMVPVPEPASYALGLSLALLCVAGGRRFARRQRNT